MCGFSKHIERKARKEYHCEACSVPIPKGFRYVRAVDFVDGAASTSRWHLECMAEFTRMLSDSFEDCGDPDQTWESGMPQEIAQKYIHLVLELGEHL